MAARDWRGAVSLKIGGWRWRNPAFWLRYRLGLVVTLISLVRSMILLGELFETIWVPVLF